MIYSNPIDPTAWKARSIQPRLSSRGIKDRKDKPPAMNLLELQTFFRRKWMSWFGVMDC